MLRNFSYILENELAGCAHPSSCGDCNGALAALTDIGIEALVSADEDGIPLYLIAEHGLSYLHVPINDFSSPTLQQAEQFVQFVDCQRVEGRKAAVHCHGGLGRTGTLLACYLVSQGRTADAAIDAVRAKRPGSIETETQERFIREFENYLRATTPKLDRRQTRRKKK